MEENSIVKKVFITGIGGFAGRYLTKALKGKVDIFGGELDPEKCCQSELYHKHATIYSMDINQREQVCELLDQIKPDIIYHMAAVVPIYIAISNPEIPLTTNVLGTLNLFQSLRKLEQKPRVIMGGSCEEYGLIKPEETPISEKQPLRPANTYAVSKIGQTMLGIQYFRSYNLPIMTGRAFNLTGPGQSTVYACSSFAKKIAEIMLGLAPPVVNVGNLSAKRDYNDIRDIVRGYICIAESGEPGDVYNICSGQAVSMQEILDHLIELSEINIEIKTDPKKFRPSDINLVIGNNLKLKSIGYEPQYSLLQTLKDVLHYWLKNLATPA